MNSTAFIHKLKKNAWPWEHLRKLIVISFSLCDISNVCLGFGFCLTTTPRGYFHGFSRTLPLPLFLLLLGSFFPLTTVFAPSFKAATPASELRWGREGVNAENFVQLTECCKSQGVLVGEKRAAISVKAKIMSRRNNVGCCKRPIRLIKSVFPSTMCQVEFAHHLGLTREHPI